MATKTKTLRFRVTEDEERRLKARADDVGVSLSDFIRSKLRLGEVPVMTIKPEESDFDKRVKQLQAKGMTGPMARALAKQELGL